MTPASKPPSSHPVDRPLRVLSLAGGGFLGLYTAVVLEALEAQAGVPLARRFDLLAGTSIGGVLALSLAFEIGVSSVSAPVCARGRADRPRSVCVAGRSGLALGQRR